MGEGTENRIDFAPCGHATQPTAADGPHRERVSRGPIMASKYVDKAASGKRVRFCLLGGTPRVVTPSDCWQCPDAVGEAR